MSQSKMLVYHPIQMSVEMKEAVVGTFVIALERSMSGRAGAFPWREKNELMFVRNDQWSSPRN